MQDQELYNKMKKHLLTQNARSLRSDRTTCAYRGEDGMKCAVGVLIPDEKYSRMMEGMGVGGLIDEFPDMLGFKPTKTQVKLMQAMQCCHDQWTPEDWSAQMVLIAQEFDLVD